LSEETQAAMADWRNSALFDERDRLVLELAESLTGSNRVDDRLYAALEARFSQAERVRLAMTIGLAGMVNRVHAMFDTEVDAATLARLGR
jgi:alkylhydroperoxidase family enzyme